MNCGEKAVFKAGSLPESGWVEGLIEKGGKKVILRKEFNTFPNEPYAHGCAIEIFNLDKPPYFEIEVHSPLYTLEPGQTKSFSQNWKLESLERIPS